MMKYYKYVFAAILFVGLTGFYLYNKPVKSTMSKTSEVTINSEELLSEFETDETTANKKYLDKILSVKGEVTSITNEDNLLVITLKTKSTFAGVVCKMELTEKLINEIKQGDEVRIKGVCTGMLMDVILVRCVLE